MRISKDTITLLKNFSSINNSLYIKSGNHLWTAAQDGTLLASAQVAEEFPVDFGIYDLGRFLSLVTFFENPEFEFYDDHVVVKSGKSRTKYRFADANIISHRNDYDKAEKFIKNTKASSMEFPVSFTLSDEALQDFLKKASVLKLADIVFTTENGKVVLQAHDQKNDLSDKHVVELDDSVQHSFSAFLSADKLKMLPGDYQIGVGESVLHFVNTKHAIEYWVAPDADSVIE